MTNKVYKVLRKNEKICFVLKTENGTICSVLKTDRDKNFWCWEIDWTDWIKYWKDKNPACLIGDIMEWAANEFVNSEENSSCGCSCGNYSTIQAAVFDYLEIDIIDYEKEK